MKSPNLFEITQILTKCTYFEVPNRRADQNKRAGLEFFVYYMSRVERKSEKSKWACSSVRDFRVCNWNRPSHRIKSNYPLELIRQSSGSHQAVIRQSSGSHQEVIQWSFCQSWRSLLSLVILVFQFFFCRFRTLSHFMGTSKHHLRSHQMMTGI